MTSEFVYVKVMFNILLLTRRSSSSTPALDKELASRPKMATLSTD